MPGAIKRVSKTIGLTPGSLVHIGDKRTEKVKITIIDYNQTEFQQKEAKIADECFPFRDTKTISWINVDGIHDLSIIEKIGECFNIHPLILEDIVNTSQRPKLEDLGDYIFIVLKMLYFDEKSEEIKAEQISIILGANFIISLQEREGDVFNSMRERIRNNKGRIRKMGADYLAYSLIDAIVDNYFIILERIDDNVEELDEELLTNPTPKLLETIHGLKSDMIFLRKSIWPIREVINNLQRSESRLVKKTTNMFLRDLYDHTIQVMDTVETLRDMVSGMIDIYLSSVSNRMNEVMKVLTIFAAIFIPLTFIAGIYGMNFKYMPELEWTWGYFGALGLMIVVAGLLLLYFKNKKWL